METTTLDAQVVQRVIRGLYRLFRVAAFHALDNEAIDIAVHSTLEALRGLDAFESAGITLIIAEDTAIVNGQLLRAPPDIYEDAMDFSRFLRKVGVNSITIAKTVTESCLRALLELFTDRTDPAARLDSQGRLTPHVRLRLVNPNLLLGLEDERLGQLERVLLIYAMSVLVLRRMFVSIEDGRFEIASYFKRMARQLSLVNYADRPVVLDVIVAPKGKPDIARLAVNSAILSVAITRRFTKDEAALGRVCMASLLLDVGRYRPAADLGSTRPAPLAISNAVVQMAMGSLRGDAVDRTMISYEAQSLLDGVDPALVYRDRAAPSFDAYVVATARRFVELVNGTARAPAVTTDEAIETLHARAPDDLSHYCVDLLTDAIGLIPRGSCVELDSGFRGVVVASGPRPSEYDSPTVRLAEDDRGERVPPRDVALHDDSLEARQHRPVSRVLGQPGPRLVALQKELAGPVSEWIGRRKDSEARVRAWLQQEADARAASGVRELRYSTSGQFAAVAEPGGAPNARARAMGWSTSESGAFAQVSEAGPIQVVRTAASAEFDRRTRSARASGTGDFDAITSGDFAVVPSSEVGLPRPVDAPVPEAGITLRPSSGARVAAAPATAVYRRTAEDRGGHTGSRSRSASASSERISDRSPSPSTDGQRRKSIREYLHEVRAREGSASGDFATATTTPSAAPAADAAQREAADVPGNVGGSPDVETTMEGTGILRKTGPRKTVTPEPDPRDDLTGAGILRRSGSRKAVDDDPTD